MSTKKRKIGSFIVALVLPFVAIFAVVPFSSQFDFTVLGFPFLYFWMFLWFPLTALCLSLAWYIFDRHDYPTEEGGDEQ